MALGAREAVRDGGVADLLIALARQEGSASHRHPSTLANRSAIARDLADAVHYLSTLYGRSPGVVDLAAARMASPSLRHWAEQAITGFARERSYLTRLVVAAGPLPSTPGQAESETAVNGQRHALEMLASSDRAGCALGAAVALVLDWRAVRGVLDSAARRFGVEGPACELPGPEFTVDIEPALGNEMRAQRALMFGAQQILLQQRGLWDLLEARQQARGDE